MIIKIIYDIVLGRDRETRRQAEMVRMRSKDNDYQWVITIIIKKLIEMRWWDFFSFLSTWLFSVKTGLGKKHKHKHTRWGYMGEGGASYVQHYLPYNVEREKKRFRGGRATIVRWFICKGIFVSSYTWEMFYKKLCRLWNWEIFERYFNFLIKIWKKRNWRRQKKSRF